MARNFDEERRVWSQEDRTFILRGETFVARAAIRPETLALYEQRLGGGGKTLAELIETSDTVILLMIEGGNETNDDGSPREGSARARYLALREREDDPLTLEELHHVTEWMFEEHAIRPTELSSGSTNGHGGTGTSSTGTSSPEASPVEQTG